jgi:hypothetical protein
VPYQPPVQTYLPYNPIQQTGSAFGDNHQQSKAITSSYSHQFTSNQPYQNNPSTQQTQYGVQNSYIPQNPKYFPQSSINQSDLDRQKIDV